MSVSVTDHVKTSFDAQTMMTTLGASLIRASGGEAEIHAPILPGSLQQQGFAHAGLTFSIGDSAAGYSALSLLSPEREVLTTEMRIHLLSPGAGDLLIARGRVIKPGRRLIVVQADVFAVIEGREKHIALLTGSMMPVSKA